MQNSDINFFVSVFTDMKKVYGWQDSNLKQLAMKHLFSMGGH